MAQLGSMVVVAFVWSVVGVPASRAASGQGGVEVPGLRTADSDTFKLPDGTLRTVISQAPVNYRVGDGSWQPINSTLVASLDVGYALENAANSLKTRFKSTPGLGDGQLGEFDLPDGRGFRFGLPGVKASLGLPEGSDGVVYPGVAAATNLHYQATASGVKERIELTSASAPSSFAFRLVPTDASGYEARQNEDGSWVISAKGDLQPLLWLAAPVVTDSAVKVNVEGRDWPAAPGPAGAVSMIVKQQQDGSFEATVSVDPKWLADPARVFPVMIDPSMTVNAGALTADFNIGAGTTSGSSIVRVGGGAAQANNERTAIGFDLSSIPSGSITSASFTMRWPPSCEPIPVGCSFTVGSGQSGSIGLYQITSPWTSTSPASA